MSKYIITPETISFSEIANKGFSLSAPQYKTLLIRNKIFLFVKDFLERNLSNNDLGTEVGSLNYIRKSHKYFLRTKALQSHTFLPELNAETTRQIQPKMFNQMDLKEGDLIISKDSNIGEIIILDKDYPNHMLSSAMYRLPVIKETKYYLLAFIKHSIFREQLDFIVPSGATIRHAKTLFLDCKIPIPNQNKNKVMNYVSLLTQAIINKEKEIRKKHSLIFEMFDKELIENQKQETFEYKFPTISQIESVGRIDTARYTEEYKSYEFLLSNYKNSTSTFTERGYKVKRGQNLQVSNIGKSHYSDEYMDSFYKLIVSSNFSEYSTVEKYKYIGNSKKLKKIEVGEIVFSARGAQFGRVVILPEIANNIITNLDSLVFSSETASLTESIFITLFLNRLRWNKHIYSIAITGSGANSFTAYQIDDINIPNYPVEKQREIVKQYYNPKSIDNTSKATLINFLELDNAFNEEAGIYELDKSAKALKERLNEVIDQIANDENIEITFNGIASA
ncbi:restriction endonuclease subunit S [Tenacibaculum maritimum]|uniref:restriction endonuclease subunit S n=1 Tax=Tenacibaculum maritimum TaxID=107401 RepID=UPI001E3E6831|nr:restriction endonuclease subunit S [Tenacibaculum maritimum]MCD9585128.1 restriction endonuclease subunit S [Tenacibaculum maritimum]MCD9620780.1 restriction endonuclease subunit S [Tenacibaculum maritimum]MCD9628446.1 restriction endonuclease subunit S [Tenacibaculum maritimum]MCD9630749.1 restriction endonuclease subunit S [Tenacibaculum maritimum]MCD9632530.1 restriction endonuclease subunit S [Tenacibaculum maritimum]